MFSPFAFNLIMHVVAFIKFTILQLVSVCPTCFFSFVSLPNASGDHLGLCSGWLNPEHLPMFVSWESFSSQLPGHAFLSLSKSHSMHTWLSSQERLKGNLREIWGELFFSAWLTPFWKSAPELWAASAALNAGLCLDEATKLCLHLPSIFLIWKLHPDRELGQW